MSAVWSDPLDELTGARRRTAGAVTAQSVHDDGSERWPARVRDIVNDIGEAVATPRGRGPARERR
jgi:hypothetical protein